MDLNLVWPLPSPNPGCGFKVLYRRKSDSAYTELDISGSTVSGSTIPISAPADYEGKVISNCCGENVSPGAPFGVNAYVLLSTSAVYEGSNVMMTLSSPYSSGYDTLVNGTVTIVLNNASHQDIPFSVTYSAGNTTETFNLGSHQGVAVFASVITAIAPVFNNGGQLQQTDSVNTPPYFMFYYAGQDLTWHGSPTELPSFTLDAFNPTEIAADGVTVLAGSMLMSYILGSVIDSTSGFTSISIEVFDPMAAAPIGTTIVNTSPVGLRNIAINLTKASSPLSNATQFTMKAFWPDTTLIDQKAFYLPS